VKKAGIAHRDLSRNSVWKLKGYQDAKIKIIRQNDRGRSFSQHFERFLTWRDQMISLQSVRSSEI